MRGRVSGIAVVTAMIVGLIAAGCGSGSSGSSSATETAMKPAATRKGPALTKAEFLTKANTICTMSDKSVSAAAKEALPSNAKTRPTQAHLRRYAQLVTPVILTQIDRIRALNVPAKNEAAIAKMFNLLGQDLERTQSEPALFGEPGVFVNFTRLAHAYGLTSCSPESGS